MRLQRSGYAKRAAGQTEPSDDGAASLMALLDETIEPQGNSWTLDEHGVLRKNGAVVFPSGE